MYDLKAKQMNVQPSLIQECMFYKLEAIKNICCVKGKVAVDHSSVTRWFKKFCSGCKNLNEQARSSRLKTRDSEDVL